jgi:hypothetical protein
MFENFYQLRRFQIGHSVSMEIKHELRTGSNVKHCATLFISNRHIISSIPFRRSVQDYKIHMDVEMVIYLQVMLYNHKGI